MKTATADWRSEMADLVRAHQAGIWRYLRFLGCTSAEAEDLAQETFLTAWRDGFEVRSSEATAAYLRAVARNRLLMLRRKEQSAPIWVDLDVAESVWAEVAAEDGLDDYLAALRACLKRLSERVRRAVEMQYRDEASRDEIAAALALTAAGVKTMLRRARTILRDCVMRRLEQ